MTGGVLCLALLAETEVRRDEHLQRILDATPFLLTRCDRNLSYRYVSRAYAHMLGRRADEIIGRPIKEVMGDTGFRTILPYVEEVLRGREVEYKAEIDFAGIGRRLLHVTYTPEQDGEGGTTGWIASLRDVTETERSEEALRKSEEQFRRLINVLPAAMYTVDVDGRLTYYNEQAAKLWGLQPPIGAEDKKYCGSFRLFLPDGSRLPPDRTPMAEAVRSGTSVRNCEIILERPDGTRTTVSVNIDPIKSNQGTILGAINLFSDITDRKMAERALRESEEKLTNEVNALQQLNELSSRLWNKKTLRDGLQDMLHATIDLLGADKGTVQTVNPDGTLSIVAQEGFEEDFLEVFREVSVDDNSCCGRTFRAARRSVICDVESDQLFEPFREVARKAGYRSVQSTPLVSRTGEVLGILSTHWHNPCVLTEQDLRRLDMYARQATDFIERLKAYEGLERLVANRTQELVELHTRLRALAMELSVAEQRERRALAIELHDHLQQLLVLGKMKVGHSKAVAQRVPACVTVMEEIDGILTDVLQYTRTLVAELSPRVLYEHGLVAGLRWLGEYMKKHDIVVSISVPDDQGLKLPEAQTILLFQSIRELLINSSKHAGTHQAWVTLENRAGQVTVEVKDEGAGFDSAADYPSGGLSSKFGLFNIRERMRALGGSFDIRSELGKGTVVTLTLPVEEPASLSRVEASVPSAYGNVKLESESRTSEGIVRVLLVDDHAMVRQGLKSILMGYTDLEIVGEAANGREALDAVEQFHPHVIIMDINMPHMNGIEATLRIKSAYPDMSVIGISVNAEIDNQDAMLKAGASMLMTKEAAVEQLYEAVRQVMRGHSTA